MDEATQRLIAALHNAPYRYVAAVTGGGAQALAMLFNVPGASRTILETLVPYHPAALERFLGDTPPQSCSAETSRLMASAALVRAQSLIPEQLVAGAGCTAGLVSDRPKRGDHRFHLSIATQHGSSTWSLTLSKGSRDREGEEAILDTIFLNALAEVFGIHERLKLDLRDGEKVVIENHPVDALLARLYRGETNRLCVDASGRFTEEAAPPSLLLPGSFNPLHEGHLRLAEAAVTRTGLPLDFAIGIENVDKPSLVVEEVQRRVRQFAGKARLWLTRASAFVQMAPLFPGAIFVVGVDTAERLVQTRYYENSEEKMRQSLAEIGRHGCRFLVAGRFDAKQQKFLSLEDVGIPEELRGLFDAIPESDFRVDVSSTTLRNRSV